MEKYGIRGRALEWFKSYLKDRTQFVEVNNFKSDILPTTIGVPQGSILGPLLFLIYINDLKFSNIFMFADDTSVLCGDNTLSNTISSCNIQLQHLQSWFSNNNLLLNSKKSVCIRFNHSNTNYNESILIKSKGGSLRQVESTKFLGLYISEDCSWRTHIDFVCKKIATTCYCIKQLSHIVNTESLKMYYYAQLHSIISYGVVAWGHCGESQRVFTLQKRAIRYLAGIGYRASCRSYFKALQILTLPSIFIMHLLLYAKTNLEELNNLNVFHSYNTRNSQTLEIPRHRTSLFEHSPKYLAIKVYNKLPNQYKSLNPKQFKTSIKGMLIEKSYYSLNEYMTDTL